MRRIHFRRKKRKRGRETLTYIPYSPRPLADPPVVIPPSAIVPAVSQTTNNVNPVISGTAGNRPSDSTTITVKVYAGATEVRSLTTTRTGANWSVTVTPGLADGSYTTTASQAWSGGTVTSAPFVFTVSVAPTALNIAMSQGPTGSIWGPDCTPVSGRPSILPRQMAKAQGVQFAQAVDFWYFWTINHHPDYVATGQAQYDLAIQRVQELGVRGIRIGLFSPTIHSSGGTQDVYQDFGVRCRVLSTQAQPVSNVWGVGKEPAQYAIYPNQGPPTAATVCRPLDHFTGSNPTANQPGGGWPGLYKDVSWVCATALMGPNEPDTTYAWNPTSIRSWMSSVRTYKNSRTTENASTTFGYVDSTTGRWVAGQAKAPQIPVVGPPLGSKSNGANSLLGDWTDRSLADYGGWSSYQYNEPHFVPNMVGFDWTPDGSEWNSFLDHLNGAKSPQGRLNRTLPVVIGESGYMCAPGADPVGAGVASTDNRPRYIPPEVGGEYLLGTMVQYYCCGPAKHLSFYKLCDENFEDDPGAPAHGICHTDFTRKEPFYAIKNMLRHVGRGQASTNAPFNVTLVNTFTPGAKNIDPLFTNTQSTDTLWKLVLAKSDTEHLVVLHRNRQLWRRYSQAYVQVADPFDGIYQLPPGSWTVTVAEPSKVSVTAAQDNGQTGLSDPDDGQNYPNPGDGMAFSSVGIAGVDDLTPDANNRITVRSAGLTRLLKIVPATTDALQVRVLNELTTWTNWLATNGVQGFLGEFGVPTNTHASGTFAGDTDDWALLLELYYQKLQEKQVWSSQWVAAEVSVGELSTYLSPSYGSALNEAMASAGPLEAHAADAGVRRGIALTGLEFGTSGQSPKFSNTNPGTLHSTYYAASQGSWNYLSARGVRTARVGFRWERLQPTLGGALNAPYLAEISAQVARAKAATPAPIGVILDCHNFGEYETSSATLKLGSAGLTQAHFVDLWTRLSAVFTAESGVVGYGIMNEPHDLPGGAAGWQTISNACCNAIRALGDAKLILVGGYGWSNITTWVSFHPSWWITAANCRPEGHHYWDIGGDSVYQHTYAAGVAAS